MNFVKLGSEFINLDHVVSFDFRQVENGPLTAKLTFALRLRDGRSPGSSIHELRTKEITRGAVELLEYLNRNSAVITACAPPVVAAAKEPTFPLGTLVVRSEALESDDRE